MIREPNSIGCAGGVVGDGHHGSRGGSNCTPRRTADMKVGLQVKLSKVIMEITEVIIVKEESWSCAALLRTARSGSCQPCEDLDVSDWKSSSSHLLRACRVWLVGDT